MLGQLTRQSEITNMLPRTYSPEAVRTYLKRIRLAQQTGLNNFDEAFDIAIARLIKSHADAIGCTRETILFPLLVAVSACMGSETDVNIDVDWSEKPILWILVAGRRGDKKTPALKRIKSAICGLEKEIQALHRTQNSNISDKHYPRFVIDEHNLPQAEESLRKTPGSHTLVGMFDNFGTFLRHSSLESKFLDPQLLLSMYDSSVSLSSGTNSEDAPSTVYCSCLAMIEAIDAAALMEMFDADGLSDRVLVVCPRDHGCHSEQTTPSSVESLPPIQRILSSIRNYHQVQTVSYVFTEDGRTTFQRCRAELELWQSGFLYDERRRGVLAKAAGHLARFCAVLTALKNGLDLSARGSGAHVLPSTAITADTVDSARQILMYLINQKMSFLPNEEGLSEDNMWEDMPDRMEVSHDTSFIDGPAPVGHKQVQEMVFLPQVGRGGRWSEEGLSVTMGRCQSGKWSHVDLKTSTYSKAQETCSIGPGFISSGESGPSWLVHSSTEHEQPSVDIVKCKRPRQDDGHRGKVPEAFREQHKINKEVMVITVDDEGSGDVEDLEGCTDDDAAMHMNVSSTNMSQGNAPWSIQIPPEEDAELYNQGLDQKSPSSGLTPSSFRSFRTSVNMFQLTDEQLLILCAHKIKKLLLLPGMIASAASICQKRLFPPVPRELRIEHPRTTHPVWGALAFLKRLVGLGLGELVHALYRMQSIHFRKIRLEHMTQEARVLLKTVGVEEEEYERSYPKFDDSHLTSFVLISDTDRAIRQRLRADGQTINHSVLTSRRSPDL
ncbi:uncharacterized protein LOC124147749 [Haliotis rufescens]|uniref:uncharacterized protein LOC124147749 n=1 Tax=Haliotis rufescens TaxID=6454 RepID=UPI00201E8490|nr:uncharacterized protein LOC124147749 [Haliotis rufescens]